jgi:hypothetical protein
MSYPADYPEEFVLFHEKHPILYDAILEDAKRLLELGWVEVGVRYLYEHQRYKSLIRKSSDVTQKTIEFGLNNNFAAHYARLIEEQQPAFKKFFRKRKTKAEISNAIGQLSFGFEFE